MMKPIVLYGREKWAMTEQRNSSLKKLERKILRKVYSPIKDQNGWRIRTNDELQFIYRIPNIVTKIKVRRLKFAHHLVRMSEDRTTKKVFVEKPDGRRIAGRLQLRWLHCIENHVKLMGVMGLYSSAHDWDNLLYIIMAATGLDARTWQAQAGSVASGIQFFRNLASKFPMTR
jgi:hypothetical protein